MILDGENCWEYYPDGGVSFLRSLYQGAVRDPRVRPVRVDEFLAEHPPRESTPSPASSPGAGSATTSPSGSATPRTTAPGTRLHAAREFLVNEGRPAVTTRRRLARAWEEIYIAEGSDWFWWFGDDHSSAQDALFDHLFRKHLRNVYTLLGCDPPGSLFSRSRGRRRVRPDARPAGQLPAASSSTAARRTSSGSTRRGMPAATTGGR